MSAPDLIDVASALESNRDPWLPTPVDRKLARKRDYERAEPVVLAVARKAGSNGFTADNVRRALIRAWVITGEESRGKNRDAQRALSWIGPMLARMARSGKIGVLRYKDGCPRRRNSDRPEAHGNSQLVYCAIEHLRIAE